ncbi:hypothetical protein Ait01nite_007180 [Actinoplanes italicus]|uniref:Ribosomally synthesized peptide with SipW-like signal peptide n=1 Tax=Actinoplanes italicus TaxID=113567 RepID=A0A2T0KLU5_9ACTN|nr:hypothetical protein [Actinoplanes italicus]PRX24600.1 hypothetical protein CLV67_102377 [Actinoplanes italicus]GIE27673.1 hypothetical protein Ait01nite_007180 [Actinoplanes italicus]
MGKFTKRTAVIAGVAALTISGGAAWAAINGWSIDGEGKANAKAAQVKKLTATTTFTENLYPGSKSPLDSTIKNPNEFGVQLTGQIQVDSATATPAGADADTCAAAMKDAGMFTTTFPGTPTLLAGEEKPVPGDVTIGSIPQACAGKTIKINYSFTAESLPEA